MAERSAGTGTGRSGRASAMTTAPTPSKSRPAPRWRRQPARRCAAARRAPVE